MKQESPKQSNKKPSKKLRHQYEYADFIEWVALPKELRSPKTQRELAKKFGVGEDTLSEWKQRDDFWSSVEEKRKNWGRERTPDVLLALHKRAVKTGDAQAVRLWYEIVEGLRLTGQRDKVMTMQELYAFDDTSEEEIDLIIAKQTAYFQKK